LTQIVITNSSYMIIGCGSQNQLLQISTTKSLSNNIAKSLRINFIVIAHAFI